MTVQGDQARADYLEALYHQDGRHDPTHPRHGVYTGLWRQRQLVLLARDRSEVLRRDV